MYVSHTDYSKLKQGADKRNGKSGKESGRKERGRGEVLEIFLFFNLNNLRMT